MSPGRSYEYIKEFYKSLTPMVPPTEPLIEHSDAASVSHPRPLVENRHAGGIIVTHARNSAPIYERSDANYDFEMDDSAMDDSEVDDSEMDISEMDDSEEEEYCPRIYLLLVVSNVQNRVSGQAELCVAPLSKARGCAWDAEVTRHFAD